MEYIIYEYREEIIHPIMYRKLSTSKGTNNNVTTKWNNVFSFNGATILII